MIAAEPVGVSIAYGAFTPPAVQIVAGDTVTWRNTSTREHTVVGEDYASEKIPRFGTFAHTFTQTGPHRYVCTLHLGMSGEVDVEPILLDPPPGPIVRGQPIILHGRAEAGVSRVTLERDTGRGYVTVGEAPVDPHGMITALFPDGPSGSYRLRSGWLVSPAVPVRVLGQQIRLAGGRRRLAVTTLPPRPGATVVLQLRLRDRFGWWPVARRRLDRRGRTTFSLPRGGRVRARVVLTGTDGNTPLVTSRTLRVAARG